VAVLDANHPLAGLALRFEIEVIEVELASEDEIEVERQLSSFS
jgi:FKBP-type peptidyl-prolyl cis-trans isomerase 2